MPIMKSDLYAVNDVCFSYSESVKGGFVRLRAPRLDLEVEAAGERVVEEVDYNLDLIVAADFRERLNFAVAVGVGEAGGAVEVSNRIWSQFLGSVLVGRCFAEVPAGVCGTAGGSVWIGNAYFAVIAEIGVIRVVHGTGIIAARTIELPSGRGACRETLKRSTET